LLNVPVEVFDAHEATAFGGGLMAAMALNNWDHLQDLAPDNNNKPLHFEPDSVKHAHYVAHYNTWKKYISKVVKNEDK
jgi:glycerol kinase